MAGGGGKEGAKVAVYQKYHVQKLREKHSRRQQVASIKGFQIEYKFIFSKCLKIESSLALNSEKCMK